VNGRVPYLEATRGAALNAAAEDGNVRAAFIERIVEPCQQLIAEALRRGAERGEVRPDLLDHGLDQKIAAVGPAMLIHQVLTGNSGDDGAVSDADIDALVDDVLLRMLPKPSEK
jgi:Tetracyclin repressor-like, C-terminal domain